MYVYTYFLIQVTRLDTSSSSILENTTQTATEVFYITHNNHTWHHHNTGPAWDSGQLSLAGSSATPGAQVHLQLFCNERRVARHYSLCCCHAQLQILGSLWHDIFFFTVNNYNMYDFTDHYRSMHLRHHPPPRPVLKALVFVQSSTNSPVSQSCYIFK